MYYNGKQKHRVRKSFLQCEQPELINPRVRKQKVHDKAERELRKKPLVHTHNRGLNLQKPSADYLTRWWCHNYQFMPVRKEGVWKCDRWWLKQAEQNTRPSKLEQNRKTHRLWRDFHQELRPWGPDQHHDKLQLINVFQSNIKENAREWGDYESRTEGGTKSNNKTMIFMCFFFLNERIKTGKWDEGWNKTKPWLVQSHAFLNNSNVCLTKCPSIVWLSM